MKGHNEVIKINKKRGLTFAAIVGAAALALSGCAASTPDAAPAATGLASGFGSIGTNRDVMFFTYYNPSSDPFWHQIFQGAQDAAELGHLNLTHVTADSKDDVLISNIQTGIAKKPAIMFIPFNLGEKETTVACQAHDAGIKVIAYNVPPAPGAADCVSAFVGQDFYAVGQIIGKQLLAQVPELKKGDKIFFPAEHAEQPYAQQRGGGVNDSLAAKGLKGTFLSTGDDDATTLSNLTAWLTANKDVKAIVPLGGTPHRNVYQAMKDAGVTAKVIGFDTSQQVIDAITAGEDLGTADQQGYVQGFQSVMQGILSIDFGLLAANINSGGQGLVTKENVANLSDPKLKGVRY
jgi:simple sugar transport system substrate-binding protein